MCVTLYNLSVFKIIVIAYNNIIIAEIIIIRRIIMELQETKNIFVAVWRGKKKAFLCTVVSMLALYGSTMHIATL